MEISALNTEAKTAILKKRAARLAVENENKSIDGDVEILEFLIGAEKYALETVYIRETYNYKKITTIPCTPSFVKGLINVRGHLLSVIDPAVILGLPASIANEHGKVVILHSEEQEFAIHIDEIIGVTRFSALNSETTLPTLNETQAGYLKGITEDRIIVLDGGKILNDKNLIICEEMI